MVSCLANKKAENIFIKANAGTPNAKKNKAFEEFLTLKISKDPYPNKLEVICSDPTSNANIAGILKNRLNSSDFCCIKLILAKLFVDICLLKLGSKIVPIAIPAIARFI